MGLKNLIGDPKVITATDVDRMCPYNYPGGPGPGYSQTFRIGVLFKAQT